MRKQGKVSRWKDGRGFGFIEPSAGGKQVFVHIKGFVNGSRRPVVGSPVSYEESKDAQGRIRAENVRSLKSGFSPGPASIAFVVAAVFLTGMAAIVMSGILLDYILWWYLGLSAVTFFFMQRIRQRRSRVVSAYPRVHCTRWHWSVVGRGRFMPGSCFDINRARNLFVLFSG